MRSYPPYIVGLLALSSPALSSCDNITAGQFPVDTTPPVLRMILIQDEAPPPSPGRRVATDLLDMSPVIDCSDRDPCPTGDKFSHPTCNLMTGKCPRPLNPSETPAAIGTPVTFGGNQIRLVFSKVLDPEMEDVTRDPLTGLVSGYILKDPTLIGVFDEQGMELPAIKYWDSTGSPTVTSDLFLNPLGPALVIKPKVAFALLANYSIRIKPAEIKDAMGQAVEKDGNGAPIATMYPFKTEGFHSAGGALVQYDKTLDTIDVRDALVIKTNARFDASTLKVIVRKAGQVVETVAAPEFGIDPKMCASAAANPQQINIFRVSGLDRKLWEEGDDYTVEIDVKSVDLPNALFSKDNFGTVPYKDVMFKVKTDIDKDELFLAERLLLPFECAAGSPADMAGQVDMAMPPDLAVPDMAMPADMAMTSDAGPPDGGAGD